MSKETISYRYFVAEGEEAAAIVAEAKAEQAAHFTRIGECVEKYGADCTWGGRNSPPCALGFKFQFKGFENKPPMKEGFLKPKVEPSGEEYYAIYYPDKRYKEGKAIKKDLDSVGIFNFSTFVTGRIGVDCDCIGSLNGQMVLAHAAAGLYGSTLVVRLPSGEDLRPREVEIPLYLREIKKSEFIAITEEGA